MELVGNPVNQCEQVYTLIQTLMKQLKTMFEEEGDCKCTCVCVCVCVCHV